MRSDFRRVSVFFKPLKITFKTLYFSLAHSQSILLEHNLQKLKMKLRENLVGVALYSTEEFFSNVESGSLSEISLYLNHFVIYLNLILQNQAIIV